jgi:hypothetical protein
MMALESERLCWDALSLGEGEDGFMVARVSLGL